MAGNGGGLTISHRLANKLGAEGRNIFTGTDSLVYTVRTCNRCMGTGQFSFNLMHGTVCYGCGGTGVVAVAGTPEEVAAAEAKKAVARERAAVRREAKRKAAADARIAESERIESLLGCSPISRREPRAMESLYSGECRYCRAEIVVGSEIMYDGSARHPQCYADMLLDDIDDARQYPEFPY